MIPAAALGLGLLLHPAGVRAGEEPTGAVDPCPDELLGVGYVPIGIELGTRLARAERCASARGVPEARRARAFFEAGVLRRRSGDSIGAVRNLEKALALRPKDPDALYQLTLAARERPEEALGYARRSARAARTVRRRAAAYRLEGDILIDLGDRAGAAKSFRRALASNRGDLHALAALVWLRRGYPEEALDYAERATGLAEIAPLWYRASAHRLCARMRLRLGDFERAVESLMKVLELEPIDLWAVQNLVAVKREAPRAVEGLDMRGIGEDPVQKAEQRWDEAEAMRALEADPRDIEALRGLIEVRRERGRLDEARVLAGRLMEAAESATEWQDEAFLLVGRIWGELGEPELARRPLLRVVSNLDRWGEAKREDFLLVAPDEPWVLRRIYIGETITPESDSAKKLFDFAALQEQFDEDGAESNLRRALEAVPGHRNALSRLFELKMRRGRFQEALGLADELAESSGDAPGRATALVLAARAREALGDEGGAEAGMRSALDLDPANPDAAPILFELWMRQGRFHEALDLAGEFALAVDDKPRLAEALLLRARALAALGDPAKAEPDLLRVLELDPANREALAERHALEMGRGGFKEAMSLAEELGASAEDASERSDALLLRGRAADALGRKAEAEADWKRALELAPGNRQAFSLLFDLRMRDRRPGDALALADEIVAAAGEPRWRAELYLQRAGAQSALGDEAGAESSLTRAAEIDSGNPAAYLPLFELLIRQERFGEVLGLGEKISGVSGKGPPRAEALFLRAQEALADEAAAEASWTRALELDPGNRKALSGLFDLRMRRKEYDEASRLADALAGLSAEGPLKAAALLRRARARAALGDEAGAEADRARAAELDPGNQAARSRLVESMIRKGLFEEALRLDPGNRAALLPLFELRIRQGRPREALALADELARDSHGASRGVESLHLRARALSALGDEVGAEENWTRAAELDPGNREALRALFAIRMRGERFQDALVLADSILRVASDETQRADALVLRGRAQARLGDEVEAEASWTRAAGLDPGNPAALSRLLDLKLGQGRASELKPLFDILTKPGAPGRASWLVARGAAHAQAAGGLEAGKDFAAAVRLDPSVCSDRALPVPSLPASFFDACIGRFPDKAFLYADRGVALYRSGDKNRAMLDFRKAMELEPSYLPGSLSLVSALAESGDTEEALAAADRALAASQNRDAPLYRELADLRRTLRGTAR